MQIYGVLPTCFLVCSGPLQCAITTAFWMERDACCAGLGEYLFFCLCCVAVLLVTVCLVFLSWMFGETFRLRSR
ncbi:hypothetical protein V8C34DRAFT_279136 [Trichoderma compactum]